MKSSIHLGAGRTRFILGIPFLLILVGCSAKQTYPPKWSSDIPKIQSYFPLIDITAALWLSIKTLDQSNDWVPAPDQWVLRGYVKIDSAQTKSIMESYTWTPVATGSAPSPGATPVPRFTPDPGFGPAPNLPTTSDTDLARDFSSCIAPLSSADFNSNHQKKSTTHSDLILLCPETNTIYFEMKRN